MPVDITAIIMGFYLRNGEKKNTHWQLLIQNGCQILIKTIWLYSSSSETKCVVRFEKGKKKDSFKTRWIQPQVKLTSCINQNLHFYSYN